MITRIPSFIQNNPLLIFGSGIIIFSLILLILSMSGFFSPVLIIPLIIALFASSPSALFSFWKSLAGKERVGLICIATLIIATLYFSSTETTVFNGRDQGSISIAAIELAQEQKLTFQTPLATDFFSIYGKGAALHFPGFFYTEEGSLTTQFPIGYTAFLGAFFQTFGIAGLILANSILLLASSLTFFSLLRKFAPKTLWLGMILFSMSLITTFLFHLTLSENLALFLFLFLALHLGSFLQNYRESFYWGALLPAILFPFVRVEGFAFLIITILILIIAPKSKNFIQEKIITRFALPIFFFSALLIADFFANSPFYHVMGKEIFKAFTKNISESASSATFRTIPDLLSLYGLLPILLAGIIGAILIIRSKKWILLVPLALGLPTLFYLLSPNITFDHPWMLRRFLFSVWPSLLLTFLFALHLLLDKKYIRKGMFLTLGFLLIIGQLPSFLSFISTKTTTKLLPQVASFADRISPTDRILIDRETTGDHFTMISGPLRSLFGKNAAYFFNPLDMEKLPFREGETTFLLVPEKKLPFYEQNLPDFTLTPRETIDFTLQSRERLPAADVRFPRSLTRTERNLLLEVTPTQ